MNTGPGISANAIVVGLFGIALTGYLFVAHQSILLCLAMLLITCLCVFLVNKSQKGKNS